MVRSPSAAVPTDVNMRAMLNRKTEDVEALLHGVCEVLLANTLSSRMAIGMIYGQSVSGIAAPPGIAR